MKNKEDILIKIEALETELFRLKEELNEKESFNWYPIDGDNYFVIDIYGRIEPYLWSDDTIDDNLYKLGNCFQTVKEAQEYKEYLIMLMELRRFAREKNQGWKWTNGMEAGYFIVFQQNHLQVCYYIDTNVGMPIFKNNEDAEEAINKFGDRLKILFTYNL